MNVKAEYVEFQKLPFVWIDILPKIRVAVNRGRGEITPEQVFEFLLSGDLQLWILRNDKEKIISVVVTEIVQFMNFKTLRVALMAGEDMNSWADKTSILEDFGRMNDCKFLEAGTRPGIARKMKQFGFTKLHEFISKEL